MTSRTINDPVGVCMLLLHHGMNELAYMTARRMFVAPGYTLRDLSYGMQLIDAEGVVISTKIEPDPREALVRESWELTDVAQKKAQAFVRSRRYAIMGGKGDA